MPTTTIDDLSIHYIHQASATAPNRQRIMYIHGTGCNARVFESHLETIAQHHEVVAIDLPGHGKSGGNGFRNAADHAFYVGALIEHLGWESCVVAGHSLGGAIALSVAIYFAARTKALMLIDTGARLRVAPRVIEHARKIAAGDRKVSPDPRFGYAQTTAQTVVDQVNAVNAGCRAEVIYRDWIADDSFDVSARIHNIEIPSLAICGAEDPLTPLKYHEFMRDKMPNCDLEIVPSAGHWPFVENPDDFNRRILDFLARC